MPLSHEPAGSKILAEIEIYSLTRAELICSLCYEIPCKRPYRFHDRFTLSQVHCFFCLTKRKAYSEENWVQKIANCSIISLQFSSSCGDLKLEVVFTKFFMQKITSLNCALHDLKIVYVLGLKQFEKKSCLKP